MSEDHVRQMEKCAAWQDEPKVLEIKNAPDSSTDWTEEINELEKYFDEVALPSQFIKLTQCETITDPRKFIDSALAVAKANNGKKWYRIYLERLKQLRIRLEELKLID
jgi:hypothetical protein